MNWLIWKEYRQNRLIVIVALVLLVLPHLAALGLSLYGIGPEVHVEASRWAVNFSGAALYSLGLCQLVMALLGGNAIAGERIDRSAEFLAYLPLSRGEILRAKGALAAAVTALIWIPNLLVLLAAANGFPEGITSRMFQEFCVLFLSIGLIGLTFFSVAWLLSSFLESPTFSICGGLITPWLLILALAVMNWLLTERQGRPVDWIVLCYYVSCAILSLVSLTAGTWYYLRRVEP